ncbi:MAG TPA: protein phosphatase 2C domain-containing protein [Gemmatimonadaceae bacterium]
MENKLAEPPRPLARRPRDDEIDVYGLTHPGKLRTENQDHFLVGSLRGRLSVQLSSLPDDHRLPLEEERVAFFMMVADGVGGGRKGEAASRLALEDVAHYIAESARCYFRADGSEGDFVGALELAAKRSHETLRELGEADPAHEGMATTLTLFIGVWPWSYLLQVGDSRYYRYANGRLNQISHDQTVAQALVDQGLLTKALSERSPLTNVLVSSIGGPRTSPVVTQIPNSWENIHLLCSDGLTKHVSDERIAERLGTMRSARQVCEDLLQDALDGGGTDNITIIVGRVVPKDYAG